MAVLEPLENDPFCIGATGCCGSVFKVAIDLKSMASSSKEPKLGPTSKFPFVTRTNRFGTRKREPKHPSLGLTSPRILFVQSIYPTAGLEQKYVKL